MSLILDGSSHLGYNPDYKKAKYPVGLVHLLSGMSHQVLNVSRNTISSFGVALNHCTFMVHGTGSVVVCRLKQVRFAS